MDEKGRYVGAPSDLPEFNSIILECQCWDGQIRNYAANVIAEEMANQADDSECYSTDLRRICNHRRDGDAVTNQQLSSKEGSKHRCTTKGWKLQCEFEDRSKEWIALSDLKESYPVHVAQYAVANNIDDEPAFKWWVPYTLRKRDVIVGLVKARMKRKTIKFGVKVPRTLEEALQLDRENGDTQWADSHKKEMTNVGVAFEILPKGQRPPPGWKKSSGHIIFDVKMDGTRKSRWVKDGHRTPTPETSSYAGVVSRESKRIALTHAALHDIPVWGADIQNACLSAKSSEKHYIICGEEFGLENVGKVALIRRALYGGKAAGRDYWHHVRSVLQDKMQFQSSRGDPDVWFREARRVKDGTPYYEYILLYTDDLLVISDRAEEILRNEIGSGERSFELKPDSIHPPSQYLGGKLTLRELPSGIKAWGYSSGQYVKEAVGNVKKYLKTIGRKLPSKAETPTSVDYRPEIDVSPELNDLDGAYYHSLIRTLRWIVELGRIDICLEVSMLSSHLALPREGHLDQALHIFAYLDKHHNAEMVFDPTPWEIPEKAFTKQDWDYLIYGCKKLKKKLPKDIPWGANEDQCLCRR